ncbi:phenylalanine--tRNA ligase beta subunit-related protein, partial [Methylobacterium sp. CG08_land_8_20_14_0_20_71_15]|uniref:phenylalanine--tRNA ligase beta subunit-related protein n=1 Tax=Methylobacterium sp. CG08_land_8_20_14_0_20_71_15 TaxID=1975531 RepID=UPI000CBCBDFA
AAELGLEGYDSTGILVLSEAAAVGADAMTLFPKADHVMEVEMLPNQAHCLSHYSLAREFCLFYGYRLKEAPVFEGGASGTLVPVEIKVPELCPRYGAMVLRGVKNAKTPEWMASRLRAMGSNPKGNILIDGSNFVMYELGQPTHCFDIAKLNGTKIIVRRAMAGEMLKTLDNQALKLDAGMMVIADASKPVALAGVMGGFDSSVSDGTDGASFLAEIWLPAAPHAALPAPAPAAADARRLRILLVESDGLVRASLAEALADLGHTVVQAGSGGHALALLAENAAYDAMIADQAMPVMTGLQLAATVVERHPGIRVVLASPHGRLPASARQFLQLDKPFRPEELETLLGGLAPQARAA